MTAELVLRWSGGELDLMGWNDSEFGEFKIDALADGTDWGNPEPVRRALRRFLLDGSSSVKEYDDNRTIPLSLRVKAADGVALAGGEQALDLIDGRRCELVWTPPDSFAAPALFKVDFADLRHKMDDFAEMARRERFYGLSLDCLPHAYSAEYVTIPALTQGVSTPTLVDDCNSLTGWSSPTGSLESAFGYISTGSGGVAVRSGTIDLSTQTYLATDLRNLVPTTTLEARSGSGPWEALTRIGVDGNDTIWDASDLSNPVVTELRFTSSTAFYLLIANIEKQATPSTGVGRQQVRTLVVPGSRRSPSSLLVESASDELGTVLIYSGPSYNPDITRGANHSRLAEISLPEITGAHTFVAPGYPESFEVPATDLPEGGYSVWVRALCTSETDGGILSITPVVVTASDQVIATLPAMTVAIPALAEPLYDLLLAGSVSLPGAALPAGSTAKVRFDCTFAHVSSAEAVQIDALLAFNRTLGTLTIAEAGSHQKMWIDPANLESDRPSVLVGDVEKSGSIPLSRVAQLPAWSGAHGVTPPMTFLYVASTVASDVEVSGTFRPAHHTHPTS